MNLHAPGLNWFGHKNKYPGNDLKDFCRVNVTFQILQIADDKIVWITIIGNEPKDL